MEFKRFCKTIVLKDDLPLIAEYTKIHTPCCAWPEIPQGVKEVGIIDLEIFIVRNRLFMIIDTLPDIDHKKVMKELSLKPRLQEWEAFVSRFQQTSAYATANEKW